MGCVRSTRGVRWLAFQDPLAFRYQPVDLRLLPFSLRIVSPQQSLSAVQADLTGD